MDKDYDCASESIGIRSITTKKSELKIVELELFNGYPGNFRKFKRQYGLYLCANKKAYQTSKEKIMFVLLYMRGGSMELWAGSYIDRAVLQKDWGNWEEFIMQLNHNFIDRNETRRAMEKLENHRQGRETASVYFLRIEQFAISAGVNLLEDPHAILQCERGLNNDLVDKIYAGSFILNMYSAYRQHTIDIDKLARRRIAWKETTN